MWLIDRKLAAPVWVAFIAGVLAACTACSPQHIERDVTQWYPYHFNIDNHVYRVSLPPGGMIIRTPVTEISTTGVDGYFIAATFGYDFGRGADDDIAQVKVRVSVSGIEESMPCPRNENDFGECLLLDSKVPRDEKTTQYRTIGGLQWFHESGSVVPWDNYSVLLGNDHYLTIEGHYWSDLASHPEMLADRRNLLEEIVSTVRKLD